MVFSFSVFVLGCCESKYNYYTCRKKGEEALLAKKYKKAQNYYSIIYTNETKNETLDTERTNWAFYRLGVIAELSGDLKMAKGYYWGDAIDDGFYEEQPLISWFAQAGWNQLDENNIPRTLEEILEFEKTTPPTYEEGGEDESTTTTADRKKQIILPKKYSSSENINGSNENGENKGVIRKTYKRSKHMPPYGTKPPFKVYY